MSFHLNPINPNVQYIQRTQRIYIDPQHLMQLKNKRKPFQMVLSIYQPPREQLQLQQQLQYNQWNNSKYMINNNTKYHSKQLSNHKLNKNMYQNDQEMFPLQKIKILQDILQGENIAPNVQFIWKLLPTTFKRQIFNYQQGDCIPLNNLNQDKYLILNGQVRIIGVNQHQFKRKPGYLFFLSNQTKNKIKQIVVLRSTKLLKIPNNIYQSVIKNYLYLKNSQKIKFIQYCPFFIWKDQLTQDLASCMQIKFTQKQQIIYSANSIPDSIYFVKQGIVLLQRNSKLMNPVVQDYQQHYQKNQITQKDTILVVRKGMAFGIDGIIIKEFLNDVFTNAQLQQNLLQNQGPQQQMQQQILQTYNKQLQQETDKQNPQKTLSQKKLQRKNLRIYTAKTLGKCQIYCLDKKILQTLFSVSDINEQMYIQRKMVRPQQLQRMSIQYTNMILNNTHPLFAHIPIKKKQIVLNYENKPLLKSRSVASLQLRSYAQQKRNPSQKKNDKLQTSPKAFLLRNKKLISQQIIKASQNLKNQLYLNQQRQKNELRNRIKIQRQKQKYMRVRKRSNQSINIKKDNKQAYILPRLGNNKNQTTKKQNFIQTNNNIYKTSKQRKRINSKQKQKLNEIINIKLKEENVKFNSKQQTHKINIHKIQHQKHKQSELVKLLEQNSRRNPSFINIKSYKSIISIYDTVKPF